MYWGVVEHVRGSVILQGTGEPAVLGVGPDHDAAVRRAGCYYVATPTQPQRDFDNPEDHALLERLLADVIATGYYKQYEYEDEDE